MRARALAARRGALKRRALTRPELGAELEQLEQVLFLGAIAAAVNEVQVLELAITAVNATALALAAATRSPPSP